MHKLTTVTVGAVHLFMELDAGSGLIIIGEMDLGNKFMFSMCKWALILELAKAKEFPVTAHFRLELNLVISHKSVSFLCIIELLFGPLHCCGNFQLHRLSRHLRSIARAGIWKLCWDIWIVRLIGVFSGGLLVMAVLMLGNSKPTLGSNEGSHAGI